MFEPKFESCGCLYPGHIINNFWLSKSTFLIPFTLLFLSSFASASVTTESCRNALSATAIPDLPITETDASVEMNMRSQFDSGDQSWELIGVTLGPRPNEYSLKIKIIKRSCDFYTLGKGLVSKRPKALGRLGFFWNGETETLTIPNDNLLNRKVDEVYAESGFSGEGLRALYIDHEGALDELEYARPRRHGKFGVSQRGLENFSNQTRAFSLFAHDVSSHALIYLALAREVREHLQATSEFFIRIIEDTGLSPSIQGTLRHSQLFMENIRFEEIAAGEPVYLLKELKRVDAGRRIRGLLTKSVAELALELVNLHGPSIGVESVLKSMESTSPGITTRKVDWELALTHTQRNIHILFPAEVH